MASPSSGKCGLCGRDMYVDPPETDPDALDCGGDCGSCVLDAEGGRARDIPFETRAGSGLILRTAPDLDQYMVWSSIAEGPTFVGTRSELMAQAAFYELDAIKERLDRAERTGTSSHDGEDGFDSYGLIFDQRGWILRRDFPAFATAFAAGDEATVEALITPLHPGAQRCLTFTP